MSLKLETLVPNISRLLAMGGCSDRAGDVKLMSGDSTLSVIREAGRPPERQTDCLPAVLYWSGSNGSSIQGCSIMSDSLLCKLKSVITHVDV